MKRFQGGYTLIEVLMWLAIGMTCLVTAEKTLATWIYQEKNLENKLALASDNLLLENVLRRAITSAGLDEYGKVGLPGHHLNRSEDQLRPNLDQPWGLRILGDTDYVEIHALGLDKPGPAAWVKGSSILLTSGLSFENAVVVEALTPETQGLTLQGSLSLKAGDVLWLNDGEYGVLSSVKTVRVVSHPIPSVWVTLAKPLGVALAKGALAHRFLWRAYYLGMGESGQDQDFDLYLQDQTGQRSAIFSGLSDFEIKVQSHFIKLQFSFLGGELRTVYEPLF